MPDETQLTKAQKQQLGAYYTPLPVAKMLIEWAVRDSADTILDPSFGGCSFLYGGLTVLGAKNVEKPGSQIYGVDVDPNARNYLTPLFNMGADPHQFLDKSFFEVLPIDFGFQKFNCIVGNPPYIEYHRIDKKEQKKAIARLREAGLQISSRASSWAFFLLHSLRFLSCDGRIAMVLPRSFARADYAATVRDILARYFEHIHIIFLEQRIFEDTHEQAVLLLAQGFGKHVRNDNVMVIEAKTIDNLAGVLAALRTGTEQGDRLSVGDNLYLSLISSAAKDVLSTVAALPGVIELGDWVSVRIGVVTGGNSFFILSRAQKQEHHLPDSCFVPIVRKPSQLKGVVLTNADVTTLLESNSRSYLLSIDELDIQTESVKEYLRQVPEKVKNADKCQERPLWYSVLHRFAPPAFFQYMSSTWPRLAVNESNATCSNNIHRLSWREPRPPEDWQRLAVGALSSLSQLSAELLGRSYGTGMLKLEPREVAELLVPVGTAVNADLVKRTDELLRQGNLTAATELVDQALLIGDLGLSENNVREIRKARDYLYSRRQTPERDHTSAPDVPTFTCDGAHEQQPADAAGR